MKRFIYIVAMLALLVGWVLPPVAFAEQGTPGSFNVKNKLPEVKSVEVIPSAGGEPLTSMTPGVSYKAKIVAEDKNTLEDIDQVRVAIVLDADDSDPIGDPGITGNTVSLAWLTWIKSPEAWSIDPDSGSGTTWALIEGNCTKPSDMGLTQGTWEFCITVGKVATECPGGDGLAGWDLFGEVKDEGAFQKMWDDRDLAMEWYGEISDLDGGGAGGAIEFGDVDPECIDAVSPAILTTYIANGNYYEEIKSSSTWTTVTLEESGDPGAGEFVLKADDDNDIAGNVQVKATAYVEIAADGGLTDDDGVDTTNNTLWLTLGTNINVGLYTGTVYYEISNRD